MSQTRKTGFFPNVLLLSLGQALSFSAAPMVTLVGGIVGVQLAPHPAWATLPFSLLIIGLALFALPAALIMRRIGRRNGFVLFALIAAAASLLAAYGIAIQSFFVFCISMVFIGANMALAFQYRFAAAESVESNQVSKAVSFVLVGGVVAAYLGPEVAKHTKDWLGGPFTGSFVILAGLLALAAVLLMFLKPSTPDTDDLKGEERPLSVIMRQPIYIVAVMAGAISFGVMNFIMTATPISMHIMGGFSLADTALVIQSHTMAMFIPSFFTGFIIARLGTLKAMLLGIVFMGVSIFLALIGQQLINYWGALVSLGVGWNFIFVGATSLLTLSYRSREKFKAQGANDLIVFGGAALTSLSSAMVINQVGWQGIVLLAIPALMAMAIALGLYYRRQKPPDTEAVS